MYTFIDIRKVKIIDRVNNNGKHKQMDKNISTTSNANHFSDYYEHIVLLKHSTKCWKKND